MRPVPRDTPGIEIEEADGALEYLQTLQHAADPQGDAPRAPDAPGTEHDHQGEYDGDEMVRGSELREARLRCVPGFLGGSGRGYADGRVSGSREGHHECDSCGTRHAYAAADFTKLSVG